MKVTVAANQEKEESRGASRSPRRSGWRWRQGSTPVSLGPPRASSASVQRRRLCCLSTCRSAQLSQSAWSDELPVEASGRGREERQPVYKVDQRRRHRGGVAVKQTELLPYWREITLC